MNLNLPEYAQYAVVLIFVLGLIFLLTLILRRFLGIGPTGQTSFSRRQRRLRITEGASLGGRHRLILVQRDNVEHLLLIGGVTDLVVETGITPPPMAQGRSAASFSAAEEKEHIEPSFPDSASDSSQENELAQSKALLDRLSKRKDET